MRVSKLYICNYKMFKGEHLITFPADLKPAVFVGVNGAGKTTILDAVIGSLWEFHLKIQGKKVTTDIRFDKSNINVSAEKFAKVELTWKVNQTEEITTGFVIEKPASSKHRFVGGNEVEQYIESLITKNNLSKNEIRLPIVVYYPVERTVLNPSLKSQKNQQNGQASALKGALEQSVDFNEFFEWFRSTEDIENEIRLNKDAAYSDKSLDAVRNAILNFLEEFSKIRVSRVVKPALVAEKNNVELEINQLSHGEKALIAMIGDIARRLVIANPGLANPLNGEGIVLIDEVDLHLHPTWQRTIIQKLQKTFSNLQFICTTHSPLIINHLEKESVFLLENGRCFSIEEKYLGFNTYGADVEDVLKVVQGTDELMPKEVKSGLQQLYRTIQQNDLEAAKELIEELKELTDPNQPELKKAETQIKYKELIKK